MEKGFAVRYLEDLIYERMLEVETPLKVAEIQLGLGEAVSLSLRAIKNVLEQSERFELQEKKWVLAGRYMLKNHPLEGAIEELLKLYGKPMRVGQLAKELALISGRSEEHFFGLILKMLAGRPKYCKLDEDFYILADWLLNTQFDSEEDIIFFNFFGTEHNLDVVVNKFQSLELDKTVDEVELTSQLLKSIWQPLHNKVLSFLVWKIKGGAFKPGKYFYELLTSGRFVLLSGGYWCEKGMVNKFMDELEELAKVPVAVEVAKPAEEVSFELTEADLEEVRNFIKVRNRPLGVEDILEAVFEVFAEDSVYSVAAKSLKGALGKDKRFLRLGENRWYLAELIPEEISATPPGLIIPVGSYTSIDLEEVDEELEDKGFEKGLADFVHAPLLEDVGEEEEVVEVAGEPKEAINYTLFYHHLKSGTMKLRKIDRGFFPNKPNIILADFRDEERKKTYPVWINNKVGLIYGLSKFYVDVPVGGVFSLSKGDKVERFLLEYKGDTDPLAYIKEERVVELAELAKQVESQEMSVFDIMCEIMDYYRQGIEPVQLYSEVNVVRRTSKRKIASILSFYYCFRERKPGSNLWVLDKHRIEDGKRRDKRKYVKK